MPWEEIAKVVLVEKGEKILDVCEGNVEISNNGRKSGVLILTNRRLVWLVKRGGFSKSFQQAFEVPLQDIKSIRRTGRLFKSWTVLDTKAEYKFRIHFGRDAMGNDLFRFIIRAAQNRDTTTLERYRKQALARAKKVKVCGINTGIEPFTIDITLPWADGGKDVAGKHCYKCGSSETEEKLFSKLFRRNPFARYREFRCLKCGNEWKYYFD